METKRVCLQILLCWVLFQLKNYTPLVSKWLTSILRQLPTVDLVLHHISPIEGALAEMEVQGDGVPQARHQHAELTLIQIDAADLVAVWENDEGFERICGHGEEEKSDHL